MKELLKSKGIKRTIASILAAAALAARYIPTLAPYVDTLNTLAGVLGALGVAHAGISAIE